jgi:sulfhydrogenase subunit beta (sulfur reductase)
MTAGEQQILTLEGLARLLEELRARRYRVVGPTRRDRAIVYDDIASLDDLPRGWTDEQENGRYRLARSSRDALFDFNAGAGSWKQFLHPPQRRLWRADHRDGDVTVAAEPVSDERFAFIGVRACDVVAIAVQDRVFLDGRYIDQDYAARRRNCFIVAVNCSKAGGTCFCLSMGTGPKAEHGFDLALSEIAEGEHRFLVEVGSQAGRGVLAGLPHRAAAPEDIAAARSLIEQAARSMGREMTAEGLPELLMRNLEHPRWDDVAGRCLTCANCTMVCPTCFCTSAEDASDLAGTQTWRTQRWDSCFTMDFSYIHGGSVRATSRARYRQWMTHKLATWHDQFGTSGCVGCGRCITWCPVGIDITEEVAAIRAGEPGPGG